MPKEQVKSLWVVVKVESGVPVMVDAYLDSRSAGKREQFLRKNMHPENDGIGVLKSGFIRRMGK